MISKGYKLWSETAVYNIFQILSIRSLVTSSFIILIIWHICTGLTNLVDRFNTYFTK